MRSVLPLSAVAAAVLVANAYANANAPASTATQPTTLLRGIPHQALFDVDFDGRNGIAVGAGGQIVVSSDAGKTWAPQPSPSPLSLLGVATRGAHSIAVGQMGLVLTRTGNGPWTVVKTPTTERLLSVDLNPSGLAVAVGSFGTVLRSTDHGASWQEATPDWHGLFASESATLGDGFRPHVFAVQVDDDGLVTIAGEVSMVLRARDALGWRVVHQGAVNEGRLDPSLFAMQIRRDGVGFAVGQSGLMLKTTDGGEQWAPIASGSTGLLLSVETRDRNVLVTGMREMRRSHDDGQTWTPITGGDIATAWYSAAVQPEGSPQVLVAGQAGTILSIP